MTGPTGDSEEEEDGGRQGGAAETGEVCVCVSPPVSKENDHSCWVSISSTLKTGSKCEFCFFIVQRETQGEETDDTSDT